MGELTPAEIGARARYFRERRGLDQAVVAGLVGIDKSHLSRLESGKRKWHITRRGFLETLAEVLGCAVSDLTGQPYAAVGRAGTAALAVLPPVSRVLADTTLDDVPDLPARPVAQLARLAAEANAASADARYGAAGPDLARLLLELHVQAVRGQGSGVRRAALRALVEACIVAVGAARTLGNLDLAVLAADRGQAAAARLEDPALSGFAAMSAAVVLTRANAHYRAERVLTTALNALERADPGAADTAPAEAAGMLHLTCAQRAAKSGDADTAATHYAEAHALAARTGERSTLHFDFGPSNAGAWELSGQIELGRGAEHAEQFARRPPPLFVSADRKAAWLSDLARGHAQGFRDVQALHHLDLADAAAPRRVRHDPIVRALVDSLDARGRCRTEQRLLDSLKARVRAG
ncbi:helix-turn-helix domain-containing protein (plasmid) [Amycolatopsis sp. FU40]|uniref:helix-turn-helix domain-containing protein n=1 Tax=Amycolatopsis sp. FU40 TaxID=2914159 RepID=UPI001F465317|nr:helix-turn-helix transcriptional regulator [Amycolatopsis sp. FU40]UKD50804.1 helix-turn-helix domain-containing protein [Amycolatopsis sp. FU40]